MKFKIGDKVIRTIIRNRNNEINKLRGTIIDINDSELLIEPNIPISMQDMEKKYKDFFKKQFTKSYDVNQKHSKMVNRAFTFNIEIDPQQIREQRIKKLLND